MADPQATASHRPLLGAGGSIASAFPPGPSETLERINALDTSLAAQGYLAGFMLATPTTAATIIGGDASGRFLVALAQGGAIVLVGALAFSVNWGNWPATVLTLILFALVAAGAGMLLGSLFRTMRLAESLGTFIALALAMLGGTMSSSGGGGFALVPHAWANQAYHEIMTRGAGVADIATELGVLALFAVVLIGFASVAFHRSITRAHG